jgi:Cu+-exporting ATPase
MSQGKSNQLAQDPVCGMDVVIAEETKKYELEKHLVYFCSDNCLAKFKAQPSQYLKDAKDRPETETGNDDGKSLPSLKADTAKTYTCPMHPAISQNRPGNCPICGMTLEESVLPELGDEASELLQSQESAFLKIRFFVCLGLMIPLMMLAMPDMNGHRAGFSLTPDEKLAALGQLALSTPIVFWGGAIFMQRALDSIKLLRANMFTLIAMGVLSAYIVSVVGCLADIVLDPKTLQAQFNFLPIDEHGRLKLYFESAGAIITLSLLGQLLELKARKSAGLAIKSLLGLVPKVVRRLKPDGREVEVPLSQVEVGDVLRIRAGEQIPVDGVIEAGNAFLNESMLTGEAMPVEKSQGDPVSAGTTNGSSTFTMRSTKKVEDSLLATIIRTVQESQQSKMPIQDLADRVSFVFVPCVIVIAIATLLYWSLLRAEPMLAISNAVTVLIIACPCALGLATPMSVLVAGGLGAKNGILIRDSKVLQTLAQIDLLAVDKTGTLTQGKPVITKIIPAQGWMEDEVLKLAASLEQGSEHPLAKSILQRASEKGIDLLPVTHFDYSIGEGLQGNIDGKDIMLGSATFIEKKTSSLTELINHLANGADEQSTILALTINQHLAGLFLAQDQIKYTSFAAVSDLSEKSIGVIMLTGDKLDRAKYVAQRLKLSEYHAQLLPYDKANIIENYRKQGHIVAMAGDGINDAPALAQADVGIAMGDGSGVALGTAGIVLVKGDLLALAKAINLAKLTMQNIRQNLTLAFAYNILAIPIAAGILVPFFRFTLDPALASAAMSLSSLSVIGNSLRLRSLKL